MIELGFDLEHTLLDCNSLEKSSTPESGLALLLESGCRLGVRLRIRERAGVEVKVEG
jgi:hypothetical protein